MGKKKSGSKKIRKKEVWEDSPCETPTTSGLQERNPGEGASGTSVISSTECVGAEVEDGASGSEGIGPVGVSTSVEIKAEEVSEPSEVVASSSSAGDDGNGIGGSGDQPNKVEDLVANGTLKKEVKTIHKRWKGYSKSVERGITIATLAKNTPPVRLLEEGFDLTKDPERFGRYASPCPWNAREFANKFSTGFSSFAVAEKNTVEGKEGIIAANAHFVSDWENIKELITSAFTNDSRSFLLHKVGNSIFVDKFDLKKVLGPPRYTDWPWLFQFALNICGDEKKMKIMREGKSLNKIMCMAYYLKLLYFGVSEMLIFNEPEKLKWEELKNEDPFIFELAKLLPNSTLRGLQKNFLNKNQLKLAGFSVFAGSDIPVFTEPSKDKDGSKTSLRLIDRHLDKKAQPDELGIGIDPLTAIDVWLDNILLGIQKACIVEHCDGKVSSSSIIDTDELPAHGSFDPKLLMHESEIILKHIFNGVTECGHTYWLFKSNGDVEFKIFDLTEISASDVKGKEMGGKTSSETDEETSGEVGCEIENPYQIAVGTYLCRTTVENRKLYKAATYESIIRHFAYLLQTAEPLIKAAAIILKSSTRNDNLRFQHFQPNLYHEWPEEINFICSEAFPEDLLSMYLILSCLEKLDIGDEKFFDEVAKQIDGAANLAKYSFEIQFAEKNCSLVAHYVWSKRHLFSPKSNSCSTFKVAVMATHEPFEAVIDSHDKSTDAKKLRKFESKIRKEKTKNITFPCSKTSSPSLSDKQFRELKKIVHMRCRESSSDMQAPMKLWMEIVHYTWMALELVISMKDTFTLGHKYEPSLIYRFQVQITNALEKICLRLAEANSEAHLPALTSFLYEIVHGVPLMTKIGTGMSVVLADMLLKNSKEVVYEGLRRWKLEGPEFRHPDDFDDGSSMEIADELSRIQQSRVYLSLPTMIENCKSKLTEELQKLPDNSERSTYPLIPKFDRNIVTFFTGMMDYLDELVNFFPLCKVGLIDATKAEVSTDFKKVSAGILLDSSMFRDDACESAKKRFQLLCMIFNK